MVLLHVFLLFLVDFYSVRNSITHQSKKSSIKEKGTYCSLMQEMETEITFVFCVKPKSVTEVPWPELT